MVPPLCGGTALFLRRSLSFFLSFCIFHFNGCCFPVCVLKGDSAVANKPEAQQAIKLLVVLAWGVDQSGVEIVGGGVVLGCGVDEKYDV